MVSVTTLTHMARHESWMVARHPAHSHPAHADVCWTTAHKPIPQFPLTALREIRILKVLNHPNVLSLKEIVHTQGMTSLLPLLCLPPPLFTAVYCC